jgi:hypothetical protein
MKQEDYPWLCYASEEASRAAQKWHFRFLRAQLIVFFGVTLLGGITKIVPQALQKPLSVTIAVLLSLGIILTLLGRDRRYDKTWFDGRAVAESVKTVTWRYMMRCEPFGAEIVEVDNAFISEMMEIRNVRPSIQAYLGGQVEKSKPISAYMKEIRDAGFDRRKTEYLDGRIRDQKAWYSKKCTWNQRRATAWYASVLVLQIIALVWAIVTSAYGPFSLNTAGLLMTAAASFTAWAQAKRHEDLTNSYSVAAQELLNIEALAERANDDNTFKSVIDQAEDAISREHTMWCAKRNISIASHSKRKA